MKRSERQPDIEELLRKVQDDVMRRLRCGTPGIIESVNANGTINVQPAIMESLPMQDGSTMHFQLPLLADVILMQCSLGGLSLTLPPEPGNEVFVVFADRCIDAFWQSGGVQRQAEIRFHDLSDGFAFPAKLSQPNQLAHVSTTSAQLRTNDGTAYIELTKTGVINLVSPSGINPIGNTMVEGTLGTSAGATGVFSSTTGQVITVVNGIVVNID